jgi:hypothetical protein
MLFLNIFIPAKKSKLTLKYTNKYVCTYIHKGKDIPNKRKLSFTIMESVTLYL